MYYPDYFTAEDIMEFEYEMERIYALENPYSLDSINAECQVVAQEQREQELVDIYPV
jgi:hypothetical protein